MRDIREPEKGDSVSLTWNDSIAHYGWGKVAAVSMTHESVGILMANLPDRYVITCAISPNSEDGFSPLHIPKSAVLSIRVL